MRILIADDNREKVGRIIRSLVEDTAVERSQISVAYCAQSARDLLQDTFFDLLLLDILFPLRDEDDPQASVALDLLTELTETDELVRPGHVVGITAFSDVAEEVAQAFLDRTWTVLHSDELSDEWLGQIRSFVAYAASEAQQIARPEYGVDVAIITALRKPEMDALRKVPWNWQPENPFDSSSFSCAGRFRSGGRECSVVSAVAPRMGMLPTAILATKIIHKFRPRLLVMPGICAGIRGEANLGDVVFANLSWDYQSGKHFLTGEKLPGFALDPHPILADPSISSRIDQLASDQAFWVSLMRGWAVPTEVIPRLHSAPMGSGAAVLADGEFAGRVRAQQRKALGIDMEAYGLYCAAEYAGLPRPLVFSMKAVCDFADEQKSDSQQHYAAYMSANAVKEFLERYAEQLLRT